MHCFTYWLKFNVVAMYTHIHVMFCVGKNSSEWAIYCTLVFVEATQTVIGRAFMANKYVGIQGKQVYWESCMYAHDVFLIYI